ELEALVPQVSLASEAGNMINPRSHALELRSQNARVAVALVEHPWHDHRGITPDGRRDRGHRHDVGDHERDDASCRGLFNGQVCQPRGQEASRVVEEAGRRREHLEIAGPAQPLVTLRAIRWYTEEVATHAPHDILVEPVDQWV